MLLDNLDVYNCVELLNMAEFFDTASCLHAPVIDFISRWVRDKLLFVVAPLVIISIISILITANFQECYRCVLAENLLKSPKKISKR